MLPSTSDVMLEFYKKQPSSCLETLKGRKNDLMILHFGTTGGNNSNYFYALYRILIKLREELNIDQKV